MEEYMLDNLQMHIPWKLINAITFHPSVFNEANNLLLRPLIPLLYICKQHNAHLKYKTKAQPLKTGVKKSRLPVMFRQP